MNDYINAVKLIYSKLDTAANGTVTLNASEAQYLCRVLLNANIAEANSEALLSVLLESEALQDIHLTGKAH